MKYFNLVILLLVYSTVPAQEKPLIENVFLITTDGFRWQEIFDGADSELINNTKFNADTMLTKLSFWDDDPGERKKKLMPFFWNVIARRGQLLGNRHFENKVNVSNPYRFSYPGYNEILTGYSDPFVFSNRKKVNNNTNVLSYLNETEIYKGKVVAFGSWSVFPYILGQSKNDLPVYSGYENDVPDTAVNSAQKAISDLQLKVISEKKSTRYDELTFLSAKEYIRQHQPKVVFIGLGQTDESAHGNRYDMYLQHANSADKMIADLWYYIQTDPFYKNKTAMIITTDHGRGNSSGSWNRHGFLTTGSSETWLAAIGPGISAGGEIKEAQQIYQKQLAGSIAAMLGIYFSSSHPVAKAISFSENTTIKN